ncbi:MAG TPA: extensin family protein, partial [Caldilineaceae bacterium]|nr:extensin family protein [Caldilineaceae bacterium]
MSALRLLSLLLIGTAILAPLSGCGKGGGGVDFVAKYEPWRATEERQCLASGVVRQSRFVQSRSSLGGPSVCGAEHPFLVSGTVGGRVQLSPAATLRCPMVPAVDHWVRTVVDPAARYYFGVPIDTLKVAASYGCRPINHVHGGRLSEHGHANAI